MKPAGWQDTSCRHQRSPPKTPCRELLFPQAGEVWIGRSIDACRRASSFHTTIPIAPYIAINNPRWALGPKSTDTNHNEVILMTLYEAGNKQESDIDVRFCLQMTFAPNRESLSGSGRVRPALFNKNGSQDISGHGISRMNARIDSVSQGRNEQIPAPCTSMTMSPHRLRRGAWRLPARRSGQSGPVIW